MDFQYNFRQAHKDRLEDAGVIQYRPADGFRVLRRNSLDNRQRYMRRLHKIIGTFVSIFRKSDLQNV